MEKMSDVYKIEYRNDQGQVYLSVASQDELVDYSEIGKFVWLCEIFCERVFGSKQVFYDCVKQSIQGQKQQS